MSDEMQVWSETVKIPTYKIGMPDKNPMFLEKRVYQGSSGAVYPHPLIDCPLKTHGGTLTIDQLGVASRLRVSIPAKKPEIQLKDCGGGRFQLDLEPDGMSGLNDIFLQFDYIGDVGSFYLGGRLIADNYNNGTPWRVGLKRFWPEALTHGLVARFWPLRKSQMQNISTPMANRMEFEGEEIWRLVSFTVVPEYAARLS